MRVCIAAGGTGGHIYPATALAKEILKDPDSEVLFVGTTTRMEAKLLPEAGFPYFGIEVQGVANRRLLGKVLPLAQIAKAYFVMKKKLKEYRPDIVVGFGNYISVPVILAAKSLKIPTMIHEQNSVAGKANLYLGKTADKVVISQEDSAKDFPKTKTVLLGNPRASEAVQVPYDEKVLTDLGLDPKKKTVLIVMGSLGSESVNETMRTVLEDLAGRDYQIVFATGREGYEDTVRGLNLGDNERVLPYVDQLALMRVCELIVSRAGATSTAEIAAMGIPAILVPSPYVPNNHQHYNALSMVKRGCAMELEEKDLSAKKLEDLLDEAMNDPEKLSAMRKAAEGAGYPNAAGDILDLMKQMSRKDK